MKKNYIFYGVGAAIIFYLWKQYRNAKELVDSAIFNPIDISIDWTHILAPLIKLDIAILNPTQKTLTISKVFVNLFYNDQNIGTATIIEPIIIPASGSTKYELDFLISTIALANKLFEIKDLKNIKLDAKGYFVLSNIEFPIYMEFTYNI